jgi:hypothetical protein
VRVDIRLKKERRKIGRDTYKEHMNKQHRKEIEREREWERERERDKEKDNVIKIGSKKKEILRDRNIKTDRNEKNNIQKCTSNFFLILIVPYF